MISLEEQIEHQKRVCEVRKDCVDTLNITIPDVQEAILATLQSIKDAGDDVVEPDYNSYVDSEQGDDAYNRDLRKYIDTLLSAYKRARGKHAIEKQNAIHYKAMFEQAAAERDEFRRDAEQRRADYAELQYWRDRHADIMHRRDHVNNMTLSETIYLIRQTAIDSARNK